MSYKTIITNIGVASYVGKGITPAKAFYDAINQAFGGYADNELSRAWSQCFIATEKAMVDDINYACAIIDAKQVKVEIRKL